MVNWWLVQKKAFKRGVEARRLRLSIFKFRLTLVTYLLFVTYLLTKLFKQG